MNPAAARRQPPAPVEVDDGRSVWLLIAAGVLGLQGLGLLVAGVVEIVASIVGHPNNRGIALLLGAVVVSYAVIVLACAWGVAGGRHVAGTPALISEFFAVVIGLGQVHTLPVLSIPLFVTAAIVIAAILHPEARDRLWGDHP